jgi:hypothetical protein
MSRLFKLIKADVETFCAAEIELVKTVAEADAVEDYIQLNANTQPITITTGEKSR